VIPHHEDYQALNRLNVVKSTNMLTKSLFFIMVLVPDVDIRL